MRPKDEGTHAHILGDSSKGPAVLVEETPTGPRIGLTMPAEEGKPAPPGATLLHVQGERGSSCVTVREIGEVPHVGPARVSSKAYRAGWDRIKWN